MRKCWHVGDVPTFFNVQKGWHVGQKSLPRASEGSAPLPAAGQVRAPDPVPRVNYPTRVGAMTPPLRQPPGEITLLELVQ